MKIADAKRSIDKRAICNQRGSYVCQIVGVTNSLVKVKILGVRQVDIVGGWWEGRTGTGYNVGQFRYADPAKLYLSNEKTYIGRTYKTALQALRHWIYYLPIAGRAQAIARLDAAIRRAE